MSYSPTIIAASLDDAELRKSIDKLVNHVDDQLHYMVASTKVNVKSINDALEKIGDVDTKLGSKGSKDGGAAKRTKAQDAETVAIEKNVAARDKQIKKNQETAMSFDQMAKAQQVAIRSANPDSVRNADTLQTMRISLDLLIEKLREARNQYSAYVAMARDASTTGDKGYYQMATTGVHRYEEEVRNTIAQIRALRTAISQVGDVIAPQGHTIQNYVNSLGKINPELTLLNQQFKRGVSLLQQQKTDFEKSTQAQKEHANGTNQSTQSLENLNRAVADGLQKEKERRESILQIGLAARETARELRESAKEQAAAGGNTPITGSKELSEELQKMSSAYWNMNAEERISPIGRALEEDIKRTREAILVIQKYNWSLVEANKSSKNEITKNSSLESLRESIKDLTEQYNRLTIAELSAGKGDAIIRKFQETTRAAQKLQRTLSTPLSLQDAKSGPERTLDDIAYKIQRLQAYKRVIPLDDKKSLDELEQVDREINRLNRDLNKYMSTTKLATNANNVLANSWRYMRNRLAFYFTVGAGTSFVRDLARVRSEYEMNEKALGILIGSAERGTQVFKELSQMALVSPYTLIELSSAAKQLTAYDIAAKDVVDTTRRLADISAAVGVPVERFTYALGQVRAFGHLTSQDARQFLNTGVPLVKELAKYYTELEGKLVSTADVYDRMKKHAVSYNDVLTVLNRMTDEGGKFFDYQAKMADTLKVQLANLTLAYNNMLNDMGQETQGVLNIGIGLLKQLFLHWKDVDNAIKTLAWTVGLGKVAQVIYIASRNVDLLGKRFVWNIVLTKRLTDVIVAFGKALKSALPYLFWTTVAMAVTDATMAILGANEAQKQFNESLRNGAKDNFDNLSEFVNQYSKLRKSLTEKEILHHDNGKTGYRIIPRDIDAEQANKAWEAMREQIENTTSASETYISALLKISNISERLRQGFLVIDDIQKLNSALKEIDDNVIEIDYDWSQWWNAGVLPDGLIENLKDYSEELENIRKKYGDIKTARSQATGTNEAWEDVKDYTDALENLQSDLNKTTDSLNNFLKTQGLSGNPFAVIEAYAQQANKMITDNSLSPNDAFALQQSIEEAKSKAVREALAIRISDENKAYAAASDERNKKEISDRIAMLKDQQQIYAKSLDASRPYWDDFTKYLKERHKSEMQQMFGNMTAEQIKSLNFQEGEYKAWVDRMVKDYAKSHSMTYDQAFGYLRDWVSKANRWSVFIPLTISTQQSKSVYETLTDADNEIESSLKKINRLKTRIDELRAKGTRELEEYVSSPEELANATNDEKELMNAIKETANAQRDYNEAVARGGHEREKANKKGGSSSKKDLLGEAIQKNVQYINEIRKAYEDFKKDGLNATDAVEAATKHFGKSLARNNKELAKYGIHGLTGEQFATMNLQQVRDYFQNMINGAQGSAKAVEILEKEVQNIDKELIKFNQKTITDSLNNELSKLKDEYELAVALDADPEMGNLFAEMWGVNLDALPRTAKEYAEGLTKALNKYLTDKNTGLSIDNILEMSDSDLGFLDDLLASDDISKEAYDFVKTIVKSARDAYKKETQDISKEWNALIEKYGGLQAKILKIYKDSVKEQGDIIKKFGSEEEIKQALDLIGQINISQDPEEITRLQGELAKVVGEVTKRHPIAVKTYEATQKEQKSKTSKAYWEDFKDSDLYAMTFEDMANNSTRAIQLIMDKLEGLKDKVKEDPASMKALMKSLEDAQKELNTRDPFGGIARSLKSMAEASNEAKIAQDKLAKANEFVDTKKQKLDIAKKYGTSEQQVKAQKELNDAIKEQADAQVNLTKAENKSKKAQENLKSSLQGITGELNNVKSLFDTVSSLFRAGGDDETADAIDAISEGFATMTTVIMGVAAALVILESSNPWLLAMAAALSVIVGLVSFLSGNSNKKITKQVEESERAVKRLENSYKDLEFAVEHAYGMAEYGAKRAVIANKQLQLVELQRQLRLEQSRDSKYRDEDKILELKGSIIDLRNEIKQSIDDITNDLLGITSVGDAAEQLVSSMIDAFRQGEDYMTHFDESFEDMIDNMIMKAIVSRVIGDRLDEVWEQVKQTAEVRGEAEKKRVDALVKQLSDAQDKQMTAQAKYDNTAQGGLERSITEQMLGIKTQKDLADANAEVKRVQALLKQAEKDYAEAIALKPEDVQGIRDILPSWRDDTQNMFDSFMEAFGIKKGDRVEDKNLSNLQQGLQSMSESTAESLEAYMNGVSQHVYYHSSLLEQIRDTVQSFDLDVQTATQAQMLLQLQQSYAVQMAIQGILEGVLTPNGRSFSVELAS